MISIILIGHARIASETKLAVEHILGPLEKVSAIDLPSSDISPDEEAAMVSSIQQASADGGALVLVDLYGATPCNIVLKVIADGVEVVTGFNVPAVLKAVTQRHQAGSLQTLSDMTIQAGKQYISKGSQQVCSDMFHI